MNKNDEIELELYRKGLGDKFTNQTAMRLFATDIASFVGEDTNIDVSEVISTRLNDVAYSPLFISQMSKDNDQTNGLEAPKPPAHLVRSELTHAQKVEIRETHGEAYYQAIPMVRTNNV